MLNIHSSAYSSEEILDCHLFDLEVDDEDYTMGKGGVNGNDEDLLHEGSGGNHRGRSSSPITRKTNNVRYFDKLECVISPIIFVYYHRFFVVVVENIMDIPSMSG